ncbi:MAG: acyltransferase family protein, partial [Solirubrobacteraceae bacterium]
MAQHAFSGPLKQRIWSDFHLDQALPVFLILMGFNAARSLDRARARAEQAGEEPSSYPPGYWNGRVQRLLIPYLTVWLVALIVGGLLGKGHIGVLTLVGVVPLPAAPGNYFITLLVQFVVVFPVFVACLRRWPRTSVAVAVAVNVAYELAAGQVTAVDTSSTVRYIYEAALPEYAVCLLAG